MTEMLKIERSSGGGEDRLRLEGKVTVADVPELRLLLLQAIDEAEGGLTMELGNVIAVDSSGIAVLVEGWKRAREVGKAFVLEDPSPGVMRVLELSQLHEIFEIRSSG